MKRLVLLVMAAIAISHSCYSQEAADSPLDLSRTLRLNYIFSGTATEQDISLAELCSIDGWAGRRVNMDKLPLRGNGQVIMEVRSEEGGEFDKVVYKISFSTLFQEWQATEEATTTRKSFENVFLVPMPSREARLTVRLFDFHGGV